MSTGDDVARLQDQVTDLEGELQNAQIEQLTDAQRRAALYAEELLRCAINIAGLDETGRSEIDIALDAVRNKAEDVGLLRHHPPRAT